jgi:hypothetical protein
MVMKVWTMMVSVARRDAACQRRKLSSKYFEVKSVNFKSRRGDALRFQLSLGINHFSTAVFLLL